MHQDAPFEPYKSNIQQVFQFLFPKAQKEVPMLTWSTIEWAKACKAFGGASYEGGLDKP